MTDARRGALLALLASLCFAFSSVFARLAYDHGSNAVTVGATRMLTGALANAALILLWREPFALPPGLRVRPAALGLLLAGYSYALLEAIGRMPVALAVLAFFTFPLLIVFHAALQDRQPVGRGLAIATGVAFAGLVLALGGGAAEITAAGLVLALAAAVGNAGMIVASRETERIHRRRVTTQMLCVAGLILLCGGAVAGALRLPADGIGWAALAAASACYAVAITSIFAAVGAIGPVQVGVLLNVEPVASLMMALVLLGEAPGMLQLAGMALVIGALVVVQLRSGADSEVE